VLRKLPSLIIPLSLLGLALYLYPIIEQLPASQLVLIHFLPVIIGAIVLVFCFKFNRSLLFFSAIAVLLIYAVMQWYLPLAAYVEAKIIWLSLTVFLPFNMMLISLLKERGMLTWWGGSRFALLFLPLLVCMALAKFFPDLLRPLLTWRFIDVAFLKHSVFSQLALVMMILAVLVLNGRWFVQATAQNSAIFITLLAGIAMVYFKNRDTAMAVFSIAGMLMLVIAVVQETWSMAYIDQLTGLPGRRALEEELLKLAGNYSIAMVDIDHFKKFNDTYGHDVGDQVLKMVASKIRQSVSGGKAFRYGGEEFTIVIPGKNSNETKENLNFVRTSVGDTEFRVRKQDRRQRKNNKDSGKTVQVTISIGVANRTDKMASPHEVIKAADKALYQAKKKGRNRVCG